MTATGVQANVDYGRRDIAEQNEILRAVVGSTVHGLQLDDQGDRDEMGIFVEPPAFVAGIGDPDHPASFGLPLGQHLWRTRPEGIRSGRGDVDRTIYPLRKWATLAAAGNPTPLLLLFIPDDQLLTRTHLGDELPGLAPLILSQRAGAEFAGYLDKQRERLIGGGRRSRVPNRPELVARHGFDVKFAGHALRLGLQGVELMATGRLTLPMPEPDRTRVLEVRRGDVPFGEALARIDDAAGLLGRYLDPDNTAYRSPLPARPDVDGLNRRLLEMHRSWWDR